MMSDRKPAVICIGSAVVDITASPVGNEGWQEKQRIDSIMLGAGGDAVNQSLRLAEEGVPCGICARVGRDANGSFLKGHLAGFGVDVTCLSEQDAPATGTALVLVDHLGDRRTFSVHGAHSELCKEDAASLSALLFANRKERTIKALSLASIFSMPRLEDDGLLALLEEAKKQRLIVFADLASDKRGQGLSGVTPFLPYIDYFMPSDYDACRMTGQPDHTEESVCAAADIFLALGAGNVVIKCGPKGAYAANKSEAFWVPAYPVRPVNTTGAGDAMTAFFISKILKGESMQTAAGYACREASLFVGGQR